MLTERVVDLAVARLTARGEGFRCNNKEQLAAEHEVFAIIHDGDSMLSSLAMALDAAEAKLQPMEPAYVDVREKALKQRLNS